jgi:hypothetical protein
LRGPQACTSASSPCIDVVSGQHACGFFFVSHHFSWKEAEFISRDARCRQLLIAYMFREAPPTAGAGAAVKTHTYRSAGLPPTPPNSGGETPPPQTTSASLFKPTESVPITPPPSPPPAAQSIHAMRRIGAYSIGTKLGEGAFAVVRKGLHLATQQQVSVQTAPYSLIVQNSANGK